MPTNRPLPSPLPADLPEDWQDSLIVAPEGADVGLTEQHGYNYLMQQVNDAQRAANQLGTDKQDKLTGTQGQIVGFDESGKAVAQDAPASGVTSFNGRAGAVVPQDGDYTASQVGALPISGGILRGDLIIDPTATGRAGGVDTAGSLPKLQLGSDGTSYFTKQAEGTSLVVKAPDVQFQLSGDTFSIKDLKTSVSDGKAAIASAITDKGVSTSPTASFSTMATNIGKIQTNKMPFKFPGTFFTAFPSSNGKTLVFKVASDDPTKYTLYDFVLMTYPPLDKQYVKFNDTYVIFNVFTHRVEDTSVGLKKFYCHQILGRNSSYNEYNFEQGFFSGTGSNNISINISSSNVTFTATGNHCFNTDNSYSLTLLVT